MPARFSLFAGKMYRKEKRIVEEEKLKIRTVAAFVALSILVMLLVVVRPTLRSNALSSRVGQWQAGRPLLLAQEQRRSSAARATDAHDANASSLSRAVTVAAGGGRSGDRLSIKEGEESLMLDSAGFRAAVAASASDASSSDATPPPVVIALMNRFYFGDRYARVVPGCTWEKTGVNLPCEFTADQERSNDSSALACEYF